jgi:hypothetical protein
MPAQRTTRTTTKPATAPTRGGKATTAKAGAATDATIRKVVQQEQAKDNRRTTTKATSTRSTGNGRRKPADAPFRAVTLVTETYLDIEGLKEDFDLASCPRCAALIPSGDKAQAAHKGFHEQIDGLDQRA